MAQRKYRTAQGKMVDFGAMLTNNELVPALGNMNVNARGDEITSDGTITKTREQIMREYYHMNTPVPEDGPIPDSGAAVPDENIPVDDWADWEPAQVESPVEEPQAEEPEKPAGTNIAQMVAERSQEQTSTPSGSLASSVAGTKTVTQEVDKTGFEETTGLKRL